MTAYLDNPVEKGYLFAGGVWQKGEIEGTPYLKQAYKLGKNV